MRILALDTATWQLSAALVEVEADGAFHVLAAESRVTGKGMHSRLLPRLLEDLVRSAGLAFDDVDGFAAGHGPGSFTGLRTGLSTLKALAYAGGRPAAGVSSLASMALAAADDLGDDALPALVPLLDARREQVYAGFYRCVGEGVEARSPDAVLPPAEALEAAGEGSVLFGSGLLADDRLGGDPRARSDLPAFPSAPAIARLAAPILAGAGPESALSLQPAYVRQEVAHPGAGAG